MELKNLEVKCRQVERSEILIAKFIDGFAAGWEFAVRKEFKQSLDIKKTKKIINKKTFNIETQGNVFIFEEGDLFHNAKTAYQEGKWLDFIKGKNPVSLQVQFCNSSGYQTKNTKTVLASPIEVKENSKVKTYNELKIEEQTLNKGYIKVQVYQPNDDKTKMLETKILEMNLIEFVSLLQNGIYYDKNLEKYVSFKYDEDL